ncbi:hypothetical protein EYF80_068253 [Liparis tanakae]|uniref:Uncharacterized protein n=1 Tax=Liparis tanakae TaxID=230148 RepID=A0A4Z2DYP3_9TELE|nr:hypothetical protein EYF80_068253 [Liparis tanakae]
MRTRVCIRRRVRGSPVSIFPSAAAGPSWMTLFTWRNSSGSSPPMMVKPKPMLLFWSAVDRKLPLSCVGSRVKSGFSVEETQEQTQMEEQKKIT